MWLRHFHKKELPLSNLRVKLYLKKSKSNSLKTKSILINYLKFILITFVILYLYNVISHFITQMPIVADKRVFFIEFPIYLALITPFYFARAKSPFYKYILPNIFGLTLYAIFDTVYAFLIRSPRISDLKNIDTIFNFYPLAAAGIFLAVAILIFLMLQLIRYVKKFYTKKEFKKTILLRSLALIALLFLLQSSAFLKLNERLFIYMPWAEKSTIKKNGRISSFLYFSYQEQKNRAKLLQQTNNSIDITNTLYQGNLQEKPNIYFIVLESFINPNYLQNIKYNQNPLAKEMLPYLHNGNFSHLISPVYGGNTAQAEFELLTGIPAFAKIDTIEFNLFKGGLIDSFIMQLRKNGYQSFATIATGANFFNSKLAYKSLGFQRVRFLKEAEDFHQNPNDKKIFDGDLFNYNLTIIKEHLQHHKEPFISYTLGMYGHIPYERNKKDRPDVIDVKNSKNRAIKRVANQFYYRTKALAHYIQNILTLDPKSIIFISSDHIPALLNRNIHYKYEMHTNIALLLYKGKFINLKAMHQYKVPQFIWSLLTKEKMPKLTKEQLEQLYFKALYQGIQEP